MIITNANLITWDDPCQILADHSLLIQGGQIIEVDLTKTLLEKYPMEEIVNARGQYVMPGNICAHTHFYGAFARGMAIPGPAADSFPSILKKLWWPLDRSLTRMDVKYSALVCLVDAIRHGTTTLVDHHASPEAIEGSLDEIAEAIEEAGVRGSLCYEVTDRNGENGALKGINENMRFISQIKTSSRDGKLSALFGLHASLTISDKTLDACRSVCPEDTGFHIHVAEHQVDEYDSLEKSGLRVVDRLLKHGILGKNTLLVHAVHIDAQEMEIIKETGCWVSHQPRSNMNNAVGLPRVEEMLRTGIKVCLGNDGFSNAMWEEWKFAYLGHKLENRDPRRMPANVLAKMAIYNNSDFVSQLFNRRIGVIKPGAQADLIFVDYHPFTELNSGNLPWHIVFGFHESMINSTMVGGKFLMKDRQLLTLDEEKIASEARKLVPGVWQRYCNQF